MLNNYNEISKKVETEDLLNELPHSLKEEVMYAEFGSLVDKIDALRESTDNDFVWAIVQ